ncbi:hypothetical protein JVT61DRAFT_14664 [Boletus reticuloceps]|uniref:Uncharacterized protein n=1 Tax=Boletus reticuloceps TaxID=495285 RepID=A0A8I2YVV9_9AGAM|nr:hypothetical protein JVT61DRAFT_14664 [Boletus reticuloceps]
MLNLAQLRMHLHAEHTNPREWLRWKRHLASTPTHTTTSVFPNTCWLPSTSSGTLNQLEKTEDIPTVIGSTEQPSAPARDDESDEIDDPDSFESIARSLEERSQLNDAHGSQDFTPPFEKKRLEELFDFSNKTCTSRRSMRSLDENCTSWSIWMPRVRQMMAT